MHRWILAALLVAGLVLRVVNLDGKSFWLDEANALRVAKQGQAVLWAGQGEAYHPPLFYMLLDGWRRLGEGEATLRLLAVLAAVLSLPLVYRLGRLLLGREAATTGLALAAGSPLLVWYAQEARPYTLLGLLCLAYLTAVAHLRRGPHPLWWLLLAASLCAGLYLHYFAVFFIPLGGLLLAATAGRGETTWRGVAAHLTAVAVALLAYGPWLQSPAARGFWAVVRGNNYVAQLIATRLSFLPYAEQIYTWLLAGGVVAVTATVVLAYGLTRRVRLIAGLRRLVDRGWMQWLLLLLYGTLLIAEVWPRGYSLKRQLVMVWPLLLLGLGWCWPWRPARRTLLSIVLALSLAATLVNVFWIPKPDWRAAHAYIAGHAQPGDGVLLEPSYMTIPFDYYDQARLPRAGVSFGIGDAALQERSQGNTRIWHVVHEADGDPQQRNAAWLAAHGRRLDSAHFYRLQVTLYTFEP